MPGWQAATGRRMKRPDRRRSNPSPPSDDQPQRRAEDAASDCDPPEGHAVAADWNTFDVHPEQAGYKGERQEDKRDQRDDQRALVDLLGPEIGELLVEQGGSLAHRLKLFGHACGAIGCFAQVQPVFLGRSEEHTSELQSLMRISYA